VRSFVLPVVLAGAFAALPAVAQTPTMPAMPGGMPQGQADMARMLQLAARNQLGVLEYCQDQGSIGADPVALQRRMLTMLPPPQQQDGLDDAEAAGKRGVVQFGGSQVPIADAAKPQGTTADAMCKKIADTIQAQAAQLPK
jgi:hypothetical protein